MKHRNAAAVATAWLVALVGMVASLGYLFVYANKANMNPPPGSEIGGVLIAIQMGCLVLGAFVAGALWRGEAAVMGRWGMVPYLPLIFLVRVPGSLWLGLLPGLGWVGLAYGAYYGAVRWFSFRRGKRFQPGG